MKGGLSVKKWPYHLLFIAVCLAVFFVLRGAPPVKTPRLPADANHRDRKDFPRCPGCHGTGSAAPMPGDHLSSAGALRGDHAKCYFCHKPQGA